MGKQSKWNKKSNNFYSSCKQLSQNKDKSIKVQSKWSKLDIVTIASAMILNLKNRKHFMSIRLMLKTSYASNDNANLTAEAHHTIKNAKNTEHNTFQPIENAQFPYSFFS